MKLTKQIWMCEDGERVVSYCVNGEPLAQVIRRSNKRIWDVVFPPDSGRENLRGFRSKSRAEMYVVQ